jgi:YVTN family beta-propeller protein
MAHPKALALVSTMKYTRIILTGLAAACPALTCAAQLLVLNKSDSTLSFIDPATGKTHATIATGNGPHEVELSDDGQLAFVSNYGASTPGNSLSVIDIKARAERKRVDLADLRRPHGLVFANGYLYLTAEAIEQVAGYNAAAERIDWTFNTGQKGTHMVTASRDGAKLFTANMGSDTISVIEPGDGDQWKQTLITVGAGPEGLDLSPDGRELWTAHSRDGQVSIIDVATRKVTHTFDAKTKRSNRLKFTPNGELVLVSDLTAGELVIFDARKHMERARLPIGRGASGILVAPDSELAYVAASGENRIAVVDLKAMKVLRTIATGNNPDGMALLR